MVPCWQPSPTACVCRALRGCLPPPHTHCHSSLAVPRESLAGLLQSFWVALCALAEGGWRCWCHNETPFPPPMLAKLQPLLRLGTPQDKAAGSSPRLTVVPVATSPQQHTQGSSTSSLGFSLSFWAGCGAFPGRWLFADIPGACQHCTPVAADAVSPPHRSSGGAGEIHTICRA